MVQAELISVFRCHGRKINTNLSLSVAWGIEATEAYGQRAAVVRSRSCLINTRPVDRRCIVYTAGHFYAPLRGPGIIQNVDTKLWLVGHSNLSVLPDASGLGNQNLPPRSPRSIASNSTDRLATISKEVEASNGPRVWH